MRCLPPRPGATLTVVLPFVVLPWLNEPVSAGQSAGLMDISADGRVLACSNRDSGTVTVVDLKEHRVLREVAVGESPEGVSFVGDGHDLAVAVYAEDQVVLIDGESGDVRARIDVFDEPYGVVSDRAGRKLYVTLEYPGQVVEIDVNRREVSRSFDAGAFVRGLALTPDGSRLLVTEYLTGMVRALDAAAGNVVDEWPPASTDNLARQIVVHPTRPKAYLPHIRSKVTAVHGEGSIFPYLGGVDLRPDVKRRRTRIPMDSFRGALVTANPWDVAVSPDGRSLYIVFAGTNDLFACEIVDDDYTEVAYRNYMTLGNNPRAVRVAPDGETFYVYNALDFEVVAYSTADFSKLATIRVCENPLGEEKHLGKLLFYSALQPMVGRRWISCASCHPDGDADGRTWHNPEGLRNTQSLAGMAWTHPIHWSADRDEVQDFEHTIRGPLMQGRGLIRGRVEPQLGGGPNRGLSEALDALAVYSNSHPFRLSPHAKDGLSEAAQRGRDLFLSERTRCAECHKPPLYTDSVPVDPFVLHDVGTGEDDESEKMGPRYDTPSLLGVYRTAPYLHHGRAATLKDVLTTCNADDRHGATSHLSPREIDDLVEFLQSLPYEDPQAQAEAAGLRRIVD